MREPPAPSDFEIRTPDWLDFGEAVRRIVTAARPLEAENRGALDALGSVLAEDLVAGATLPPWDNSAMDGYAVRADDVAGASPSTPVVLEVTGHVRAGEPPATPVEPGRAVRIMTGAPVPAGADSVVRVEDTDAEAEPGRVRILHDRDRHKHVRPAGEDMRLGDVVLAAGHTVGPGVVGLLAALGHTEVRVHRRPRVAILATGDELRSPDRFAEVRVGSGVPESNGPMVAAAVAQAGGDPLPLGIVPDDVDRLTERIRGAAGADVLVTLGGASMGEADLVKRALDALGFEQDFWRVRIRPGSPFSFGWLPGAQRRQAVFGLPGNPTSAFVTFEIFVRPFLRGLLGHRGSGRRTVVCQAGERLSAPAELTYFLRVSLDPSTTPPTVALAGPQGSGLVSPLAHTDGLAVVPPGIAAVEPGDPIEVLLLRDGPSPGA